MTGNASTALVSDRYAASDPTRRVITSSSSSWDQRTADSESKSNYSAVSLIAMEYRAILGSLDDSRLQLTTTTTSTVMRDERTLFRKGSIIRNHSDGSHGGEREDDNNHSRTRRDDTDDGVGPEFDEEQKEEKSNSDASNESPIVIQLSPGGRDHVEMVIPAAVSDGEEHPSCIDAESPKFIRHKIPSGLSVNKSTDGGRHRNLIPPGGTGNTTAGGGLFSNTGTTSTSATTTTNTNTPQRVRRIPRSSSLTQSLPVQAVVSDIQSSSSSSSSSPGPRTMLNTNVSRSVTMTGAIMVHSPTDGSPQTTTNSTSTMNMYMTRLEDIEDVLSSNDDDYYEGKAFGGSFRGGGSGSGSSDRYDYHNDDDDSTCDGGNENGGHFGRIETFSNSGWGEEGEEDDEEDYDGYDHDGIDNSIPTLRRLRSMHSQDLSYYESREEPKDEESRKKDFLERIKDLEREIACGASVFHPRGLPTILSEVFSVSGTSRPEDDDDDEDVDDPSAADHTKDHDTKGSKRHKTGRLDEKHENEENDNDDDNIETAISSEDAMSRRRRRTTTNTTKGERQDNEGFWSNQSVALMTMLLILLVFGFIIGIIAWKFLGG